MSYGSAQQQSRAEAGRAADKKYCATCPHELLNTGKVSQVSKEFTSLLAPKASAAASQAT